MSLDDPEVLERECATSERLARLRHNVTGWVRGEEPCYGDVLSRRFPRVEERDTEAHTLRQTREDLQMFLDASAELLGPLTAPDGSFPSTVTRRSPVSIAEKAS